MWFYILYIRILQFSKKIIVDHDFVELLRSSTRRLEIHEDRWIGRRRNKRPPGRFELSANRRNVHHWLDVLIAEVFLEPVFKFKQVQLKLLLTYTVKLDFFFEKIVKNPNNVWVVVIRPQLCLWRIDVWLWKLIAYDHRHRDWQADAHRRSAVCKEQRIKFKPSTRRINSRSQKCVIILCKFFKIKKFKFRKIINLNEYP